MLFFAFCVKWLRGARLIYRITDFYPEVLIAAWGKRPFGIKVLERITWALRRRVDGFQALGEDQRQLLLAGGVAAERVIVKRDIAPVSFVGVQRTTKLPAELAGRMVLLYSGNYGVAHETETVIAGLIRHHQEGEGRFGLWLNASGSSVEIVTRRLSDAGVPFACTQPASLDQLPTLLVTADAHLITLRSRFSGLVVPSKLYGCLESGRPVLFVGPKSSDVHLLCSQANRAQYEHVEPGDSVGFAQALARLARQPLNVRSYVKQKSSIN
jgi:hypothetical protein